MKKFFSWLFVGVVGYIALQVIEAFVVANVLAYFGISLTAFIA